jgi:uncharacterized protein (DUF305 family)
MRLDATADAMGLGVSNRRWLIGAAVAAALAALVLVLALTWKSHADTDAARSAAASFGPIDIGFAQSMAQHHDQAILMSQILMAKPSSQLGRLAIAIQTKQLVEVGHMQAWLRLAGQPLLPRSREMDWMLLGAAPLDQSLSAYLAACRAAGGAMPGMASTDELNALRERQGRAADRLFLEMMIRHHAGALPMADFAARQAETPQVRALATSMRLEQGREIQYLEGLLSSRFASGS